MPSSDPARRRDRPGSAARPGDGPVREHEPADGEGPPRRTKGESFPGISAIARTAPEHGAATHLLQDLVVDRALARSGSQLTSRVLRQALAPAAGEKDIPRAFAWDHISDAFGDVVNNPNFLNAHLGQIFGGLGRVLIKIDKAWEARYLKLLGKKAKPE